jgi:cysteinyl-tRNA synthetase
LEYTHAKLYEAESSLERIYFYKDELTHAVPSPKGEDLLNEIDGLKTSFDRDFANSITDDFNTPAAIAAIFEMVRSANKLLSLKLGQSSLLRLKAISEAIFETVDNVLGVAGRTSEEWFAANLTMPASEVEAAIEKRAKARREKDFALADAVRADLAAKGVELIDTAGATRYRTKRVRSVPV